MDNEKDTRTGHRQRVRDRYLKTGLSGFAPHEVLELLLQFSIPRKDTKKQAYALLKKFGNINAVFSAKKNLLMNVDGIGERSAILINLVMDTVRYCDEQKVKNVKTLDSPKEFGEYAMKLLSHRTREAFYVFALDANCKLLYAENVGNGTPYEVLVNIKDVVMVAIENQACAVVLAHNHPSGVLEASCEDIEMTTRVNEALKTMEVTLLDHVIVCDDGYISLAEKGFI